jgi:hypothetical protein
MTFTALISLTSSGLVKRFDEPAYAIGSRHRNGAEAVEKSHIRASGPIELSDSWRPESLPDYDIGKLSQGPLKILHVTSPGSGKVPNGRALFESSIVPYRNGCRDGIPTSDGERAYLMFIFVQDDGPVLNQRTNDPFYSLSATFPLTTETCSLKKCPQDSLVVLDARIRPWQSKSHFLHTNDEVDILSGLKKLIEPWQ